MNRPDWAPPEIDLDRPNAARVYDFFLGGSHNFAADREMARMAIEMWPELPEIMQANRGFLRRAVRFMASEGIRQFLDIGSGIPTVGNVHEVAQGAAPDSRVVYVDIDPVAVAQSRQMLAGDDRTEVVHGDVRKPDDILEAPETTRLIDFDEPVGVLMVALLHFVGDDDRPADIVRAYHDAIAPGSYLALSHASAEGRPDQTDKHQKLYERTPTPMTMRPRDRIVALFDGFDIVEPGVVYLPLWRPESPDDVDEHPERFTGFAGVGRKPGGRDGSPDGR